MRRRGYDKAKKEAILKAVLDARKAGKKWAAAHEAALAGLPQLRTTARGRRARATAPRHGNHPGESRG